MRINTQHADRQATMWTWSGLFLTSLLIIGCGTDYETAVADERGEGATRAVELPPVAAPVPIVAHAGTPIDAAPDTPVAPEPAAVTPDMMDDIDESVSRWAGVVPAENPHAAYLEAESLYYQGMRDEAIPPLRASIAARPSFVPAHYLLGLCSRATGELEEAEAAFEETIRLDDTHLRAYTNLARVLIDADRPADARDAIQAALEMGLESDGLYNVLGLAHLDEENGELADEAFTAAIDLNPENLYALNNLGLLRIRQGRYEDAVDPLTQASQLDGAPAYVFNNLGMALERSDRLAESVGALATARDAGHAGAAASYERVRATFDQHLAQLAREAKTTGVEGDVAAETSTEETVSAPKRPVIETR